MKSDGISFDASARVLVIGLGKSGRASITILRGRGVQVLATDESAAALAGAESAFRESGAQFVPPQVLAAELASIDLAVLSPGVPMTSPVVRLVQNARIPVLGEVEVAYRLSKAPIIAVTGTKGKTTTTALIGALLRHAGRKTYVGGNIGDPLIAETDRAPADAWVVAEVSSFQLESIRSFKPKISTILNLSPDHLDRYSSMDEYAAAKCRIYANQGKGDIFVGNLDDEDVSRLSQAADGSQIPCETLWFSRAPRGDAALSLRNERIVWSPPTGDPSPVAIMPISEIALLGSHNVENVLAAILIGLAAGLPPEVLRCGVRDFRPLAHRLQPVAEIDGVTFVNDSKATNPGAVVAALEALSGNVILIAGGRSKGTDFASMGKTIDARARLVILIGEAAGEIAGSIARARVTQVNSLEEAIRLAHDEAEPGEVVVLSPGCSSFDMFTSAEERGERFTATVRALRPKQLR
jgi:UDP-N-acetylmuramoylalanine--D-glutamate ligase